MTTPSELVFWAGLLFLTAAAFTLTIHPAVAAILGVAGLLAIGAAVRGWSK